MRSESIIQSEVQQELISLYSSEEPLRQFYAAVFPTQKIAATFSYSGFPSFPKSVVKSSLPGFIPHPSIRDLVLDRKGVLHEEPDRLLEDEMREGSQATSLLSLIGMGCNRLSEIAGRLGKPSGSLTRPLSNLIELGYVRREVPFGEDPKSSKRTLYRLNDPFLRFHVRFVQPQRSLLEMGIMDIPEAILRREFEAYVGGHWEDLARRSVPFLPIGGLRWGLASRWWGAGTDGLPMEFDVVAESLDRQNVLVGEVKWTGDRVSPVNVAEGLMAKVSRAPFVKGRKVVPALWLRSGKGPGGIEIITPDRVLEDRGVYTGGRRSPSGVGT